MHGISGGKLTINNRETTTGIRIRQKDTNGQLSKRFDFKRIIGLDDIMMRVILGLLLIQLVLHGIEIYIDLQQNYIP